MSAGRVTAVVSCVVVVVVEVGSCTSVVQELRNKAKAGRMEMRLSFFITGIGIFIMDSSQVPWLDVLKEDFSDRRDRDLPAQIARAIDPIDHFH